jgi:hypothetical protein
MMMRIADEDFAAQVMSNLGLNQKLIKGYKLKHQPHRLKLDFGQKIKIFLIEPMACVIKWSLTFILKIIIVLLRGLLAIFSIVGVILR